MVVDADNVEQIRNAIIALKDNPELCERFGLNARRAYEEKYNWNIMRKRLLALYNKILSQDDGSEING